MQNDREWAEFAGNVLLQPEAASDPRFATNTLRVANRGETDALVGAVFASTERPALIARLEKAEIAFADINDMAALSRHPHLHRISVELAEGDQRLPAPAARFASHTRDYGPVPALGSHSRQIRAQLGLED